MESALIVGGGFIGIEMAEMLQERYIDVNLVEAGPQVMAMLDPEMAAIIHNYLNEVDGNMGQAFTASPMEYSGTVSDILELSSNHPGNLALQVATLNALVKGVGLFDHTIHCRDADPELCARAIARTVMDKRGKCRVGIIGYASFKSTKRKSIRAVCINSTTARIFSSIESLSYFKI
ncbi:MAG: FAD-dependent oxidoreductase [Syntrophomonas sp.]